MRITAVMLAMRQLPSLLCVKTLGKDRATWWRRGGRSHSTVSAPGLRGSKSAGWQSSTVGVRIPITSLTDWEIWKQLYFVLLSGRLQVCNQVAVLLTAVWVLLGMQSDGFWYCHVKRKESQKFLSRCPSIARGFTFMTRQIQRLLLLTVWHWGLEFGIVYYDLILKCPLRLQASHSIPGSTDFGSCGVFRKWAWLAEVSH